MEREKLESLSFEDTYARLEQIIQRLEEGNLTLEESISLYEEGMQLAEQCDRHLNNAELKVTQLLSAVADEIDRDNGPDAQT
ncbi:MAG: exodeoxyribonuclease VII small subunit [Chloroflexi bacterium]|nr:exodeoxyribonuclease VII small subunit [Chloroflexota bacterium]